MHDKDHNIRGIESVEINVPCLSFYMQKKVGKDYFAGQFL